MFKDKTLRITLSSFRKENILLIIMFTQNFLYRVWLFVWWTFEWTWLYTTSDVWNAQDIRTYEEKKGTKTQISTLCIGFLQDTMVYNTPLSITINTFMMCDYSPWSWREINVDLYSSDNEKEHLHKDPRSSAFRYVVLGLRSQARVRQPVTGLLDKSTVSLHKPRVLEG